jgi:DNA-binding transcriptional MerR regulator
MAEPDTETDGDADPLYNIGAVSSMTNIMKTTLRVWERRYHFPGSVRTAGGHRLYSQQEIMRLKWVKQRMEEGMQVRHAIQALYHLEKQQGIGEVTPVLQPSATEKPGDASLSEFKKRVLEALLAHNTEGANLVLSEATAVFPQEILITDVISPVFFELGEAWSEGRIDVATEHLSTNLLRQNLLTWMRTGPPAFHVNPVILACAPGELHEGSLLMLGVLLRRLRWPLVYLGQSMPLEHLAPFVEDLQPSAIVLVAMTEETAQALRQWPQHLPHAARTGRPIVGFGGRAFTEHPELAEQTPGVLLGATLQEGIDTLDRLLHELYPLLR